MNLTKTLKELGLSEKEAKVYLSLLSLKEALPSIIAKHSGIKRPTTYLILEQLIEKGLSSKIKKGHYYHFQPITPHNLVEKQFKIYKNIEEALPELLQLHEKFAVKPQVSYFEGKKGIIQIMEDTLTTSTELLCWADATLATKTLLKEYYPTYIKTKVERKIWLRGIFSLDEESVKLKQKEKEELREICLIPKKDFPFKNEINIYDDKVAIVSHEDEVGIIIQNKNIAETQRSIFNFSFKYAKLQEKELLKENSLYL